ncbi:MAG TPA: hypothetical protein VH351_09020 [Bryobacteraceae bacterium]|jgi:hypothetical protein|nr:hypothetical protein [Bryobacteraceae bacterium]
MKPFAIVLLATALAATILVLDMSTPAFAQSSAIQGAHSVGTPVLGFVAPTSGGSLTPVMGIPGASRLGPVLPAAGSSALYVAPRGAYVLASEPGASVSIASLRPGALQFGLQQTPISAALVAPDLIVFSPTGSSAALYSKSAGIVQVLLGLPNSPHVGQSFPTAAVLSQLGVSDDGEAVFAQEQTGRVLALNSGLALYTAQSPTAIAFLPGTHKATHKAMLADSAANCIVELDASGAASVLSSGLTAPAALAVSLDGTTVLVASASRRSIWALNRNSGKSQEYPVPGNVKSFQLIAATDTFLITYREGNYGVVSWRNNRLSTYFVGVFRSGVN